LANTLRAQGKLDEAIRHYKEVLRINPDNRRASQALQAALAIQAQAEP